MQEIIAGLALAAFFGWSLFAVQSVKLARAQKRAEQQQQEFERLQAAQTQLQSSLIDAQDHLSQLSTALSAAREEQVRSETESANLRANYQAAQSQLVDERAKVSQLNQVVSERQAQIAQLRTQLVEKQHYFDQQVAQSKENHELLKREFESLAQEILEKKGRSFNELSQQTLKAVLTPMRTELDGFKSRIEQMHQVDNEQRVQLRTELVHLQKLNKEITDQAEHLTKALQGQRKLQGNWGELILENVLESAGLRLGKDYRREVSVEGEEGKYRPDVVVYLPQDKHLIIDAKTSLSAYTRYVNADDETERAAALQDHARAVESRIQELADKRYDKVNELNSPEVVIMFVPIESAYVEALKANERLFQSAIEQHILVATPTTLLTSLNIVRQLWRLEDQSKHSAQLADRAERFYNKLNIFLHSMRDVGNRLDSARETYDRALGQLYSGRGNLIKQAAEFKELGVAVKKELPEEFVDKASLELELNTDRPANSQS